MINCSNKQVVKEDVNTQEIYYFTKIKKENTYKVVEYVTEYVKCTKIDKLVIASTTGFTAQCFAELIQKNNITTFVCKQDLNDKLFMSKQVEDELEGIATICDIPRGYLRELIGIEAVDLLRGFSQGYKVCTELLTYLRNNKLIHSNEKILVVAGTVVGADTAIEFTSEKNGKFKAKKIVCMSIN